MRSIIFANYLARDTTPLSPTWMWNTINALLGDLVLTFGM
jgi:hypothetical protein